MAKVLKRALPELSFKADALTIESVLESRAVLTELSSLMTQLHYLLELLIDGELILCNPLKEIKLMTLSFSNAEEAFAQKLKARKMSENITPKDLIYLEKVANCMLQCSILIFDIESFSMPHHDEHECGYELTDM